MLGIGTHRRRSSGPVVNGYTRRHTGLLGNVPPGATGGMLAAGQHIETVAMIGLSSAFVQGTGNNVKTASHLYMTTSGIQFGDPTGKVSGWLGAVRGDNASSFGAGGIHGGPALDAGGSSLWLEYFGGRVRVWADRQKLADAAFTYGYSTFSVLPFCDASGNPDSGETAHKTANLSPLLVMRRRDIEYADLPALGTVTATFAGGAVVTTQLDGEGAGVLLVPDSVSFPVSISYAIKDGNGSLVSTLPIPASYGGDVIAFRHTWIAPAGAFSPASLHSLALWLSPDSLAGATGDAVNVWQDKSAGRRDFTKHATLAAPVLSPLLGGRRLVRFDGAARSLQRADAGLRIGFGCWFFVFKYNALATGGVFSVMPEALDGWNINYNGSSRSLTGNGGSNFNYLPINGNDLALHVVCIQHAPTFTKTYLDGNLVTTGGAMGNSQIPNTSIGTFYAGADMSGPATFGQFDIGEVVMAGKILSDADRNSVIGFLKAGWNVP